MSSLTETSSSLDRWHQGNQEGLDTLLERNLPWVRDYVRMRLGPRLRGLLESSDIVQDAAVEFLRYSPRFLISDEDHFRALLARIVENVLRGKYHWFAAKRRDMARLRPLPPSAVLQLDPCQNAVESPSQQAMHHEDEALVRMALELLEPDDREIVILREWDRLSYAEIGGRLDIDENAAWMRHSRAVTRLALKVKVLRERSLGNLLMEECA